MYRYLLILIPYFVMLFAIYRHLRKIRGLKPAVAGKIKVSVVVACKNEETNIPDLLVNLAKQDYPLNSFEVIIVDDHSSDRTMAAAQCFSYHLDLKIIQNDGSGKKHAIKTGIDAARGELILTTDADCSMEAGWIRTVSAFFELHKPDLILAPVMFAGSNSVFGKFQELEFLSLQAITAGTAMGDNGTMCNGANLAFRKTAYLKNADQLRFDIATGDDVFLLHSMKARNGKIMWLESEDATVTTEFSPDISSFFRQRKRWASKSTAYRDPYSITLGIVTFVTNLLLTCLLAAAVFKSEYINVFFAAFLIKSVPDFILLMNTTGRYKKRNLMWWFLPSQIVYPFYVVAIATFALFSFPSRKGT